MFMIIFLQQSLLMKGLLNMRTVHMKFSCIIQQIDS